MTDRVHLSTAAVELAAGLGLAQATVMDLLTRGWSFESDLQGERWVRL